MNLFLINILKSVRYILIFLVTTTFSFAQTDYNKLEFEHYTTSEGLTDDFTNCISQDKTGYIWIGSKNGLSRFNGYSFKSFEKDQQPLKFRSDRIVDLKNFNDSLMGVITLYGAHLINTYSYKNQFFQIKDTTAFSLYLNSVRGFEKLGKNYVFLSRAGFFEFDQNGKITFEDRHHSATDMGTYGRSPEGKLLEVDSENVIIYSAKYGVELYNSTKKRKVKLPSKLLSPGLNAFAKFSNAKTLRKKIAENEYIFIPLDSDSIYYLNIKTNFLKASSLPFVANRELLIFVNKIYILGINEYAITSQMGGFFNFTISKDKSIIVNPKRFLPMIDCTSLLKDKEGRLWVCSVNGLYKQKNINSLVNTFKLPIKKPETEEEELLGGVHLVGNYAFIDALNFGFVILDIRTNEIKQKINFFNNDENWNLIASMQSYYQDTLWISTPAGILWLNMINFNYGKVRLPEVLQNMPLYMAPVNENGIAWMCGFFQPPYVSYNVKKRTFEYYDETNTSKSNLIRADGVTTDSYGNAWFHGYGLSRWNNKKQIFDTVIKDFGKPGEFKQAIDFVRVDNYGSLWIGIGELGLLEYNIKTNKINLYKTLNSVNLDYIQTSSPIIEDRLWLVLTNKLLCLNVKTKKVSIHSQGEKLPRKVSMPQGLFYIRENNEFIAVAGSDLVLRFKNEEPKPNKKQIIISELNYNEITSLYHPKDTIKLKYYQNSISIYFDVIDFNLKYPQKFKYSIDGDSVWRNVEQKQPVFIYNLNDGWHSLTIKFDYDDKSNTPKTFHIFIEPPFWRTIWFYMLIALITLCSAYLLTVQLLKRSRKKNDINLQLKEFEFKALHAQMNPHFIFNSLNSIKALVVNNRVEEASNYINGFSKLVRLNLEHSKKQFITLKSNIDYIELYLQSESLRFTNFSYELILSPVLKPKDIKIAPMLIQPLIENAIWHGLQSNQEGKQLVIRFKNERSLIVCEIEDNGPGINKTLLEHKKGRTSIGIENIQQRIKLINDKYKLNYSLQIFDKSDLKPESSGTLVILSFNHF